MSTKTNKCPICGNAPLISKEPLWRDCGGSIHGYYKNYNFVIRCSEDECPMSKMEFKSDDIYRSEDEAKENIRKLWNDKCNSVKSLMNESRSNQND